MRKQTAKIVANIGLALALVQWLALACPAACAQAEASEPVWIESWGASQQIPEPQNAVPTDDLRDATVRQIFHLSAGGVALRVHVSNSFGTEALRLTSVHLARPVALDDSAIDPATDTVLTFAGKNDVTIPPGAEFVSDAVIAHLRALSDVAISYHLDVPPKQETGHPGSRATSYIVHGDATAAERLVEPKHVDHWYGVSAIDVLAAPGGGTVVALGDSITDGHGATTNGNDRWTDVLAARLQQSPATANIGVSNQASAAITCSLTAWGRMRSRALIAMCLGRLACAG